MKHKLLNVERYLLIYNSKTREEVSEIQLRSTIEELRNIVFERMDDEDLYDFYELTKDQLEKLLILEQLKIDVNFKTQFYVLACFGNYDW